MSTAFGALVRDRRRTLTLTPDQLAQRMNARGHAVDIPALEEGHPTPQDPGFLNALAGALEWRVGILRVARDFPAHDETPSHADRITSLQAMDEATMIREEMVDLQEMQQVLMQWTEELTNRAFDLRTGTRAQRITSHFNA